MNKQEKEAHYARTRQFEDQMLKYCDGHLWEWHNRTEDVYAHYDALCYTDTNHKWHLAEMKLRNYYSEHEFFHSIQMDKNKIDPLLSFDVNSGYTVLFYDYCLMDLKINVYDLRYCDMTQSEMQYNEPLSPTGKRTKIVYKWPVANRIDCIEIASLGEDAVKLATQVREYNNQNKAKAKSKQNG